MCLLLEIAMLVMGITTLIKGEIALSKNRIVRGPAAYIIGAILSLVLPIIFGTGMVIGITLAAQQKTQEQIVETIQRDFWWIDIAVVVLATLSCVVIALIAGGSAPTAAPSRRRAQRDAEDVENVDDLTV